MKKIALIITLFLFICSGASAQGFFKKVGKEAKDKTSDRAESTIDKAVDKAFGAIDDLFGLKKKDKDNDKKGKKAQKGKKNLTEDEDIDDEEDDEEGDDEAAPSKKVSAAWDCANPECLHKGNTGKFCSECGAKRPVGMESSLSMYGLYTTKKIAFIPGSAELKFESFNEIQKIAEYMKKDPKARLIVQVLYFNVTPDRSEEALSEDRAENIVKALVELGCDEFSLKAEDKDYGGVPAKDRNGLKGMYVVFTKK